MSLAKAIERLRLERGLTQNQLAQKAGWNDPSRISKLEHGRVPQPSAKTIADIAAALDVSTDYLLTEAGLFPPGHYPKELDGSERRLIHAIRTIPTPSIRQRVLEMLTWIAETGRAVDLQERSRVSLAAESREDYGVEE